MSRFASVLAVLLTLLPAGVARGDRREIYTTLGYEPGVSHYSLGDTGSGEATRVAGTLTATGYYGLTNTWHIGGRLRLASTRDVRIGNAVVLMPNGTEARGDVFEDHRSIGAGAVVLYRIDIHAPVAPILELEGGFTYHQFQQIAFIPRADTHSYAQASTSDVALHGSAAVLVEYRFAERWVAAAGVSALVESGDMRPWSLSFPMRVGFIW